MFQVQGPTKQTCTLLAILSGSNHESKPKLDENPKLPFPDITSSGRLEVQLLKKPRIEEIRKVLDSSQPNIVYLQGEILENNEIGSLIWDNADLSTVEALSEIFNNTLPTTVYLEIPNGEKLGEALRAKGVPYVIYWKNTVSSHSAGHFRHALFSVIQSSSCHTWDAFQLAEASYKLYCGGNNRKLGQGLMGEPPKNMVPRTEMANNNIDDEEGSSEAQSAINIYDDDVTIKFLICGSAKILDMSLLGSLEDGLNALLNIEIRGSKVHNRVSALPPPLHAANFSRGVVTMRCDVSTSSSAHISLLISGSADTCFDDQLLENHIKSEIIEKSEMTHVLKSCDELLSEPRKSDSIACGASVYEVTVRIPSWASQILRQLAPDTSYRSLVALGIASIQGLSVSAFEKDDTERLLFFSTNQPNETNENCTIGPPAWLRPPPPIRRRSDITQNGNKLHSRQKLKAAALRPIPHIHHQKMLPFTIGLEERNDGNTLTKPSVPTAPVTHHRNNSAVAAPVTSHRKSTSAFQAKQIISLNPLPLKKHGCGRSPMHMCAENDFLKDVMQFLILRGHTRLIPQGGVSEFPDAILNAKRLDLYNLYREVVSRGGFHVGNGINWKGQVFSKMRNHTATNRMTGVGNTLKRHYETYLLEYELAHDDVDGECCLLCHSSAAGDWVNCGICGEWAHLGCDRRPGLGTFKDYAKTDGLEYICPQCSISNMKKKMQKTNGYS